VAMTDSNALLSGTTTASFSSGVARFSNLIITSVTSSDKLIATLALNPTINLTTQSTPFQAQTAVLTSPTPGSVLDGPSVTFTWTGDTGVTNYALWLGLNGAGSSDLYASGWVTATSADVTGLPVKGATIYARLYWEIGGKVAYSDYIYTEASPPAVPAEISTPSCGAVLGTSNVRFTWSTGTDVTEYQLWLGLNGPGSSDLYVSGWLTTTTTTVPSLPGKGVTVYARLYSMIGGKPQYFGCTFTEGGTPAAIASPASGSVLGTSNVKFTWSAGIDASQYQLWLGLTGPGSSDLYTSGWLAAPTTSTTVTALPAKGATVYARLYSDVDGVVEYNDYTYVEQ